MKVNSTSGNTFNLPYYSYEPLTGHVPAASVVSYEDVERALEVMGIDIPTEDIYSVLMEPQAITVEYYPTPKRSAKRSRAVFTMVFEKDQDYLWETAV